MGGRAGCEDEFGEDGAPLVAPYDGGGGALVVGGLVEAFIAELV